MKEWKKWRSLSGEGRRRRVGEWVALLQVAHEGGGGAGGFFDFREGTDFERGLAEFVGQQVGVGGDDAEEIAEGVGNHLILGEGDGHTIGFGGRRRHLRAFLEKELRSAVRENGSDRLVEGIGGELIEGEATGSAGGGGFGVEMGDGAGVKRDDREGGIFGADFFDVAEALEIPGVDVNYKRVPPADGERLEETGKGFETVDAESGVRVRRDDGGEGGPCQVFA